MVTFVSMVLLFMCSEDFLEIPFPRNELAPQGPCLLSVLGDRKRFQMFLISLVDPYVLQVATWTRYFSPQNFVAQPSLFDALCLAPGPPAAAVV